MLKTLVTKTMKIAQKLIFRKLGRGGHPLFERPCLNKAYKLINLFSSLPFSIVYDERLDFLRHDVRVVTRDDSQIVPINRHEDRA